MGEISIQLKKGVIEILILKVLSREEMYGYQLLQEIDRKSKGIFRMKEGTLYPVLYRLEDARFIKSVWEDPALAGEQKRVPRKYYRITERGLSELERLILDLKNLISGINLIFGEDFLNEGKN
jgi:DNA-binding PadR family transcriptional regulator